MRGCLVILGSLCAGCLFPVAVGFVLGAIWRLFTLGWSVW